MSELETNRPPVLPREEEGAILPPPRCIAEAPEASPGETSLHDAAFDGDVAKVRAWLDLGCDVNAQDTLGNTALHVAALEGRADVVRLLLARADIDETIENRCAQKPQDCVKDDAVNAVFAQFRKKSGIRLPVEFPKGYEEEEWGWRKLIWTLIWAPLCVAMIAMPLLVVVGLGMAFLGMVHGAGGAAIMGGALSAGLGGGIWLGSGYLVGREEKRKQECRAMKDRELGLVVAIQTGVRREVKRLLSEGLNPSGYAGNIPLHVAVSAGNAGIVRELLAHGADPNAQDREGYTPVFRAIMNRDAKVAKALLESPHTSLDIPNKFGLVARNFTDLVKEAAPPVSSSPEEKKEPPRAHPKHVEQPAPAPK